MGDSSLERKDQHGGLLTIQQHIGAIARQELEEVLGHIEAAFQVEIPQAESTSDFLYLSAAVSPHATYVGVIAAVAL